MSLSRQLTRVLSTGIIIIGSSLGMTSVAFAAPCPFTDGSMEINVKGGDPIIKSMIGAATTEVTVVPAGNGCFRHYTTGSIYWSRATGAQMLMGAIRAKWSALGWERGFLGFPVTDETKTPDGVGRFNHFQGGSIYWHPSVGAFEVHGDIRHLWSTMGWEKSALGFPITDETKTPDGVGRFNHFQNGSIYWKPNLGPQVVLGTIRHMWASQGWERNANLGYPISNELPAKAGSPNRYSDFENGVIYWVQSTNKATILGPFPLASRSKEDLEVEAQSKIATMIAPFGDKAYVSKPPVIAGVGDYRRNGFGRALNRQIKLSLQIKYKAAFLGIDGALPDPSTDLELWLNIDRQPSAEGTLLTMTLMSGRLVTHVPIPTRAFIAPETINNKLKNDVLQHILGKPQPLGVIPAAVNVLSVKISPRGDLQTYIEPLR